MTLTSIDAIAAFIKTSPEKLRLAAAHTYTIKELTGGTANWVFRITDTTDGSTSIIKHAEGFVRLMPSIAFAADRMNYEAAILVKLQEVLPPNANVAPAQFLAYDQDAKLLRMSDGGEQTLKSACISGLTPDEARNAGRLLGEWLADLHHHTRGLDISDHQTAKKIYRHSYNNVAAAMGEYGLDPKLGERANEEFGAKLASDSGMVCMGDFWTGNVIVRTDPLRLTVVDWEMTRDGNGVTDVGQFAAEAWLLAEFHTDQGLLAAFLTAYRKTKGDGWDAEFADRQRIVIHFAVHVAYWPTRVQWGNREATKRVVQLGSDMLRHAMDKDFEYFENGPLAALF